MKILWVAQYVRDLDRSLAFYQSITDLGVLRRFPAGPGVEIAFLGNGESGETKLELIADRNHAPGQPTGSVSVGLAVTSVQAQRSHCVGQNLALHQDVRETPSSWYFSVRDPDGLVVQFFEMKP